MMARVGINGFGRIGRAVFRINHHRRAFDVVAVNDLDPNAENLAYLLRYDSTYGRIDADVRLDGGTMAVDGQPIQLFSQRNSADVPWKDAGVDILIDATGVHANVLAARRLVQEGQIRKAIITWSPDDDVDLTVIFGVNEDSYRDEAHSVISTSICDAGAAAPVLKRLDDAFGIESGFITTLHPWLSYQNLVDGLVSSVASPGHFWQDFSLGRSSVNNLIPKPTTLVKALSKVLPELAPRLDAMSFRVPTAIVAASDLTLTLGRNVSAADVNDLLQSGANRVLGYQDDHLVSVDFAKTDQSVTVDGRWTRAMGRTVKLVLWYDNEWGYSGRVVDMAVLVAANCKPALAAGSVRAS